MLVLLLPHGGLDSLVDSRLLGLLLLLAALRSVFPALLRGEGLLALLGTTCRVVFRIIRCICYRRGFGLGTFGGLLHILRRGGGLLRLCAFGFRGLGCRGGGLLRLCA